MNIRSCENCKKLFQSYGNSMCPKCIQEFDEKFTLVKNFLYDNPGSSMETICEETGVDSTHVMKWLREGRLMTDAHGPSLLTCLTCGTPIRSGKYCEECNAKLIRTLEGGKKAFAVEPKKTAEESKRKESRFHIKS